MISKKQVSTGTFWVEVPEVGLSVLCGCPADIGKHLRKKGFIVEREERNCVFETGPNAILLSDVLVQNGAFSNLSEFPVIQMMYRQGMVIPGHPNNSGRKPLLLGSRAQVNAQAEYIYRGAHGLATEEELVRAGVAPKTARDLIRMKKKFAFGKIRRTNELLDSIIVENEPVEIMGGVSVHRLRMNVFEFRYKKYSVLVDLNLPPSSSYESPYILGYHNARREYFEIIHSGDGDGWDPNRPCMASIVIFQGKVYLVDAGPNILHSLEALGIGVSEVEGVFHTHAHDDHFCGLPALMQVDHRIKYYATKLVRLSVAKKLAALVSINEEDFQNYFEIHDLEPDAWNEIDGLEVRPMFSPHPVETNIFLFRAMWLDGYRTYGHFADITGLDVLKQMITGASSLPGIRQEMYNVAAKNYAEKTDLKKIDVGMGMIHGNAEDFKDDGSKKLILSHTSQDLTPREKEIGSGAPFGTADTLIPALQDYLRMYAFRYLETYSPEVPQNQLRLLASSPMRSFNPQTIVLKAGTVCSSIYLILSGGVEMVNTGAGISNRLSPGTLIGEISALMGLPLGETYVTTTFVNALEIPLSLYLYFTEKNGLMDDLTTMHEKRNFLQKTWLFGESISSPVQNRIARAMIESEYRTGEEIQTGNSSELFIISKGRINLYMQDQLVEILRSGDFFAEQSFLFNIPCLFRIQVEEDTQVFRVPGDLLLDIPIVRWKLLEAYNKRMELLFNPKLISSPIFQWREEYRTNVAKMDEAHRLFFEKADLLYRKLSTGEDIGTDDALNFLTGYAEEHFREEEKLMKKLSFPEFAHHKAQHDKFLKQLLEMGRGHHNGKTRAGIDFTTFLRDWIVMHILTEDKKYGAFFNEKGVF
jgi:hemerythrin